MDKTKAGKCLRKLRREKGETLRSVSAAVGISCSALSMYEKVKLSKHYGKSVEEIFFAS